jgi:hypothetical protein
MGGFESEVRRLLEGDTETDWGDADPLEEEKPKGWRSQPGENTAFELGRNLVESGVDPNRHKKNVDLEVLEEASQEHMQAALGDLIALHEAAEVPEPPTDTDILNRAAEFSTNPRERSMRDRIVLEEKIRAEVRQELEQKPEQEDEWPEDDTFYPVEPEPVEEVEDPAEGWGPPAHQSPTSAGDAMDIEAQNRQAEADAMEAQERAESRLESLDDDE